MSGMNEIKRRSRAIKRISLIRHSLYELHMSTHVNEAWLPSEWKKIQFLESVGVDWNYLGIMNESSMSRFHNGICNKSYSSLTHTKRQAQQKIPSFRRKRDEMRLFADNYPVSSAHSNKVQVYFWEKVQKQKRKTKTKKTLSFFLVHTHSR